MTNKMFGELAAVMPAGVTETAAEAGLVPTELVAVTVQLYAVPLLRPVTLIGLDDPLPATALLPFVQLALYPVIAAPPFDAGAVKATEAEPLPAVAAPIVGAPGNVSVEPPLPPPVPPLDTLPPPPQPSVTNSMLSAVKVRTFCLRCFGIASLSQMFVAQAD